VARINVCLFCIDGDRWAAIKASMNEAKFDALEQYSTSPLFADAERAALDYVTELTRDKKVTPDIFARLSDYYSEREICEIVWLAASEHIGRRTGDLRIPSPLVGRAENVLLPRLRGGIRNRCTAR
jgi:alkylhydroperoxidase family enzyme